MKIQRRKIRISILFLVFVVSITGCSQASTSLTTTTTLATTVTSSSSVPAITASDAYNLILQNKNNPNFVILDVRTANEFNSGYIAGAVNIDYYAADFKTSISKLDKNKQYLVYCKSGVRGAASVQIMLGLGFTKVQNLAGGITQWVQDGYPTVQ